ncbi:hypothetical protein DM02DRAFT_615717 [Periconia macrospinosa]|uniref:OPA3-domain-containing protein n=1 Tax=Periconia macrospinosa TaxID=97972 RepID=A0A2V1DLT6_9PLEO|nr:hypothetical protein DM02DRAFT_615717 [Periconia macrospinosa]
MSLTLKVTSLAVRTLAKPIANQIKRNAHEHERFRKICVRFAQGLHRIDMRMRLGLLQDPAVIDRQIAKEVKAAEAARQKSQAPTVKTEAETIADENMTKQEREAARKKVEAASRPRIRPLSEAKAIETGANFVAETFLFAVAIGVIVFEQWRQRRKAQNQRDDIREDVEELQAELKAVKAELEEIKAQHPESNTSGLLGLWKGKGNQQKTEDKSQTDNKSPSKTSPTSALQPPSTSSAEAPVVEKK